MPIIKTSIQIPPLINTTFLFFNAYYKNLLSTPFEFSFEAFPGVILSEEYIEYSTG